MSAHPTTTPDFGSAARAAVADAITTAMEGMGSDEGFARSVKRLFGVDAGNDLLAAGTAAVLAAAKRRCHRHLVACKAGHWGYDRNAHLATIALVRAAEARMHKEDQR